MGLGLEEFSVDEVRQACIQYASEHCCYGTKFTKDSEIQVVYHTPFYYYKLETFAEKREIRARSEPYRGQIVDDSRNGSSPGLWDISVELPTLFKNNERKFEVPHSASIRTCLKCFGTGNVSCDLCSGMSYRDCNFCIQGMRSNRTCVTCSGAGQNSCWTCNGTGRTRCRICNGVGQMKHCKELIVTWTTHLDYFYSDVECLPRHLLLEATGKEIFREQNPKVTTIDNCENQSVNAASRKFILKHEGLSYFQAIRMQRHTLCAIPICKSTYTWKNKSGEFYVYGYEKKVYFESYPQKCCCCTFL